MSRTEIFIRFASEMIFDRIASFFSQNWAKVISILPDPVFNCIEHRRGSRRLCNISGGQSYSSELNESDMKSTYVYSLWPGIPKQDNFKGNMVSMSSPLSVPSPRRLLPLLELPADHRHRPLRKTFLCIHVKRRHNRRRGGRCIKGV